MARLHHIHSWLRDLLAREASSGVLLFLTTAVALAMANSSWSETYHDLLQSRVGGLSLHFLINDVLMSFFFFVIGLEIKYELTRGSLNSRQKALLPVLAAIGGMIVPALIYSLLIPRGEWAHGWGVPMATDIAFAVGVLALLGSRVPVELKIMLLALAIVDDLGAVAVIGLFYSGSLQWGFIGGAILLAALLIFLVRRGRHFWPLYAILGLGFWLAIFRSGLHVTVAGCLLGFMVPEVKHGASRLKVWIARLHPWSAFFVMPVFAWANAGIHFGTIDLRAILVHPLVNAVSLGLLLGKPIGISGLSWLGLRLKWVELPASLTLRSVFAIGLLGGIGFTMALFIASLAFQDVAALELAKIGIIKGSLISALLGACAVLVATKGKRAPRSRPQHHR